MKKIKLFVLLFLLTFPALEGTGQTFFQIKTADFVVCLRKDKAGLQYKAGLETQVMNDTTWYAFNFGNAEDKGLSSADFSVTDIRESAQGDVRSIAYTLQHRLLPLQIVGKFTAYSQTGVIEQTSEIRNTGIYPVRINEISSGSFSFPGDKYEYSYMTSVWSKERKIKTTAINDTTFVSKEGRSSAAYSTWMCLHQSDADIYYITQLAWSGNWSATIEKQPVSIRMSEYFDNGFLTLMPGKAHTLPPLLISGGASMDNAANHLHRYQNDFLVPKQPAGLFMPVQFNSWFALLGGVTAEKLKPYVAKAADLGCEVFVIDAGWYGTKDWFKQIGDWYANPESFPNGLIETADDVRRHGMKFGLWFELELWGESSKMFNEHPEWCLQYDGVAIHHDYRKHLDFSHPEAFQWALDQFDRIYHECKGIDWVKLDYNNSIGSRFENENGIKTGDRLHRHIRGYYAWLDSLRTRYPEMMIENCASGGLRLDNGIAAHAHTTWLSDETTPNPSIGMAWSSTLEYIPRALNHWMVGRGNHDATIDPTLAAGYYDFMLKIPMNGQFGISSRIIDWSPELFQCAVKNVQLYKRIRTVIATADCYHLTPQPDYDDPTGWMALQYVSPDRKQSVLTAYRTRSSEPTFNAILQGLDLKRKYKVSIDGVSKGVYTGGALMKSGLTIALPDEYRASVVEINEK